MCRFFEEPELMQRCWDVIDAQAEIALLSEGFTDIDFNIGRGDELHLTHLQRKRQES